jgi:DNA-binding MarR family transcriptional regulator
MNAPLPIAPHNVTSPQVLRRFRLIFNAVKTHFRHMEKQVGLGGAQVWALSIVRDNPGIGMNEVAAKMDIHQSTASNLIKSLIKKTCVRMERGVQDRRSVELHILPAGLEVLSRVTGPFEGVLPDALGRLSTEVLARLDHDLEQLIRVLEVDEQAAQIPLAQL